jgi:AraC-like DNA-binding protein
MSEIRHVPNAPTISRWLTAGGVIGQHRHDEHQVAYAGRGVIGVTTEDALWLAPAAQAIWIPAGTAHSHSAHVAAQLHLIGVPVGSAPELSDRPTALTVGPLLRELIKALTRDPPDDAAEQSRLRGVLADQLRAAPQHALPVPVPSSPVLKNACAILQSDPGDPSSLADLARAVHVSERTLSRLFRSDVGLTYPQWRRRLRLSHALVLLADGVSVTATAHKCGWSSVSAFIETFRSAFGYTPGAATTSATENASGR